jgi:hypothetical protein
MAKKQKMLEDFFCETLKDIYYAEKKIRPGDFVLTPGWSVIHDAPVGGAEFWMWKSAGSSSSVPTVPFGARVSVVPL